MNDFFSNYENSLVEVGEFMLALGSIIGLLGLIIGFIMLFWGGSRMRTLTIRLLIISFILLGICGFSTGVKYFRIFH